MITAVEPSSIRPSQTPPAGGRSLNLPSSPLVVVPVLLAVYFMLAGFLGSAGYLGTDSGGKVATLEAVSRSGEWSADLGYWAEAQDPDGSLYPFFGTRRLETGWVNVTSIPMVYLAQPLYDIGGLRLALLLPMFGSIGAALAGGALARRMGDETGALAIWTIGLASPLVVYALDFWEHSLGVAAMTSATVLTLDSSNAKRPAVRAVIAGLLFALAASMRQEAFIYGAVAGCFLLFRNRSFSLRNLEASGGMLVGFVGGYGANGIIESALFGEAERAGRATAVLSTGVGRGGPVQKVGESILTLASPINLLHPASILLALVLVAGFFGLAHGLITGDSDTIRRSGAVLSVFVLLTVLRTLAQGPSFIPGMVAASPLAGIGLGFALKRRAVIPVVFGLLPLPVVWWFQYPGAAAPQWAGRYVLQSGMVLMVFGLVCLREHRSRVLPIFLAAQLLVTLVGVAVVIDRTRNITSLSTEIALVDEVTVFQDSFVARELGPAMLDERWLSVASAADRIEASELLTDQGIERFVWVSYPETDLDEFRGFTAVDEGRIIENSSLPLRLTTFAASGG